MNDKITERSTAMAEMFSSGLTLKQIGCKYGLCKERIRQIIKPHNLDTKECGGFLRASKKKIARKLKRDEEYIKRKGCTYKQWKELLITEGNPTHKYWDQRRNASGRGIEWKFKLWTWWKVWADSGKWLERGKTRNGYVMARLKDAGPYSPDNVEIITLAQNSSDQYAYRREKGETIGRPKLNLLQVRIIRRLLIFGATSHSAIARSFNISSTTVGSIKHGRTHRLGF